MTIQLHRVLLALVVINLVFVQITGAVTLTWMLPLFGLTMAAPFLSPLQSHLSYRIVWNVGLLAIFSLLLAHLRRSGVRFLLEDGLILAAFCQVHVLNNLHKQQKPDLIFFNSFLIALVTGFFCQDLVYCAVFFVYAAVLIIALGLSSSGTVGHLPIRTLSDVELRRLLRRSCKHCTVILALTAVVFAFWPRDFEREGMVQNELIAGAAANSEIAFADEIRLDRKTNAVVTDRIVMRAKLVQGSRLHVSSYWRGATFSNLTRRGWFSDTNPQGIHLTHQLDEPWTSRAPREFARRSQRDRIGATVSIKLTDRRSNSLFVPLEAHRIEFNCNAFPNVDGNFRVSVKQDEIQYEFELGFRNEPREARPGGRAVRQYRWLNGRAVPAEAFALGRLIDSDRRITPSLSQAEYVEVIRKYLTTQREYFLPGEDGAVDNLADFIAGKGGGHCEFFASTMVILLRKRGIPCRMVGGYLAHEWNEAETELTIRSNHAHAWVEVWDRAKGWQTVDPTPAQEAFAREDSSLLAGVSAFFDNLWKMVTSFDSQSRVNALAWIKKKLTGLGILIQQHPIWFTLILVALFALRRLRAAWRRPKTNPAVADYLSVLGKLGLARHPGETPRQLLARVRTLDLPAEALERLAAATTEHEQRRYCP